MKTIHALGLIWPFTGRLWPPGTTAAIRRIHDGWMDLCWWNDKIKAWAYLSTLKDDLISGRVAGERKT